VIKTSELPAYIGIMLAETHIDREEYHTDDSLLDIYSLIAGKDFDGWDELEFLAAYKTREIFG